MSALDRSPDVPARDTATRCGSDLGRPDERIDDRTDDSVGWLRQLDTAGCAVIPSVLAVNECEELASLYADPPAGRFRSHVVMQRHGFGRGEYRYFDYPLPPLVEQLRHRLYEQLHGLANAWNERMNIGVRYPRSHAEFLARCHAAGQRRATPLLLRYGPGDYNCLHQDLYGQHVFPMQATVLLSQPGRDFDGGEFVLTEQRPRMQSRPHVVPLGRGDAVIFAVHHRPVRGTRGDYRVTMRHGVAELRRGQRQTLGIILHDAT